MYEEILSETLKCYRELPVVIPQKGVIAGFAKEYVPTFKKPFAHDNYHYPMGTAFLKYGICGIAKKAEENAARTKSDAQKELLSGIATTYYEIAAYLQRYVTEASERIQLTDSADEQARLAVIRENMRVLSTEKPQTFLQGVQLYYIMWKLRAMKSIGADLGRLDMHLFPLFQNDMEEGRLTEDTALDILCEFYERLNENNSGDTLTNISVGGMTPDGTDASNRLSVLMLLATAKVRKTEPHLNVRYHSKTRKDLIDAMLEVQYMGHGQGSTYFDETVIPALIQAGIPAEVAYAYTNDGCTEITFDGYSNIELSHIDAVATLETTVNNGAYIPRPYFVPIRYFHKNDSERIYKPDVFYGYETGNVEECETFEAFYQCFLKQFRYQVFGRSQKLLDNFLRRRESGATSLLLSGTFDFVLENGIDLCRGGFPVEYHQLFSGSLTTVADCLCAIKKAIYEEKRYTWAELKDATANNFEGQEVMRQILLHYPKFGNDIDEVDLIAADLAEKFCDYLDEFSKEKQFLIVPCLLGHRYLEEAHGIAATFDGRKYGYPIAEHYCATPGRAINGPTALINSIGKTNLSRACGVATVHVSLPRRLADTKEQSLEILHTLVLTAKEKGFNMINISIYDVNILKEAQKHPEQYEDVIIRVWGFSARFIDLCREMQDHVISRVEHLGV